MLITLSHKEMGPNILWPPRLYFFDHCYSWSVPMKQSVRWIVGFFSVLFWFGINKKAKAIYLFTEGAEGKAKE